MVLQLILHHLLVFMYVTLFFAVDSINQVGVRIDQQSSEALGLKDSPRKKESRMVYEETKYDKFN